MYRCPLCSSKNLSSIEPLKNKKGKNIASRIECQGCGHINTANVFEGCLSLDHIKVFNKLEDKEF